MARSVRTVGLIALTAVFTAVLVSLVTPGCTQNQANSPISISQGRLALTVACSMDGSVAYLTDGRNVYRYDRNAAAPAQSWQCILSQAERLDLSVQHDPREQQPAPGR
jgi:hypothetical protein